MVYVQWRIKVYLLAYDQWRIIIAIIIFQKCYFSHTWYKTHMAIKVFRRYVGMNWIHLVLEKGPVTGSCEHGTAAFGSL